jgi:hypothetical protein
LHLKKLNCYDILRITDFFLNPLNQLNLANIRYLMQHYGIKFVSDL